MGPEHDAFEREFAMYCGSSWCLGVANGTDALEISLRAIGVLPGDEVVMVANAGGYAATACVLAGAVPVFADVSERTLLLDPAAVEPVISDRTRAIVVTHLYGRLADVAAIVEIAESRGIKVVEDCAQAHGAVRDGRCAGTLGDVGTFSFYPTKNLGAFGDGGAVITDSPEIADGVRALRQYGWDRKYNAVVPSGRNSRLDEIQAAFLRCKLPNLDADNLKRRAVVARYVEAAEGTGLRIVESDGADYVAHLCVGLHDDRDGFMKRLADRGIATAIHFPTPDHRQPALAAVPWRAGPLVVTEHAADHIVSLPCFPELAVAEIDHVCAAIAEAG
jgi:dTDP-4-amino-4,6-dideoxygalactose transaminase